MREQSTIRIIAFAALALAGAPTAARADAVTAQIAGGTLKIKGDADANTLVLDQAALGANQIRVTPTGTTINGAAGAAVLDGFTGGIQIDLGGGDDTFTLDAVTSPGTVKLALGPGDDTVTLTDVTVNEALAVDLGGGNNALSVCSITVDQALRIKVSIGTGTPRTATCGATTANANGTAIVIDSPTIHKGLVLKGSQIAETVVLNAATIDGKSTLTLGGGSDSLSICDGSLNASFGVDLGGGGSVTAQASCGASNASGANALVIVNSSIGDDFRLKGSSGADSNLLKNTNVGDNSKIDLGGGTVNGLVVDGGLTGESLTIKASKGGDSITVNNAGVGANLTINVGAGANTVTVSATTNVGGNLTVKTGADNDTIDTSGAVVAGKTKIQHGKGTDTITP